NLVCRFTTSCGGRGKHRTASLLCELPLIHDFGIGGDVIIATARGGNIPSRSRRPKTLWSLSTYIGIELTKMSVPGIAAGRT
ncbi:hypothetical protein ABTK41_20055, partial [Acinetobacter baumannii]